MGASMGGLISYLLVWNYPDIFSQAACLSPAFFLNPAYMSRVYKGREKSTRIYIDSGAQDLEVTLRPGCDMMLKYLQEQRGFKTGENLQWFLDEGAGHSERAWAERLWRPMTFMFGVK